MTTRYGVSRWIHELPRSRRPAYSRLRGRHEADVVIIGGGMTGCAAAYACAVAGRRALLLEADRIGQGSAGRSAGLLLPEPGPSFVSLTTRHGLRSSRHIFEAWRQAALDAASLLRRLAIPCALEPHHSITTPLPGEEKVLRKEHDARVAAGLGAQWLTSRSVAKRVGLDAPSALRVAGAFALDPYRACLGIAAAAVKRGTVVAEQTRAVTIRARSAGVEVTTEKAVVLTRDVIVATGSPTGEFAPLQRHFDRREQYVVVTEPVPAAVRRALMPAGAVLSMAQGGRAHWTPDQRLVLSGADQREAPVRGREAVRVQRTGQLMYELLTTCPAISGLRPQYGWETGYGETTDGVMYAGPHRNYPRHLFALGGRPDSLTDALLAARLLVRALQGAPQRGDDVFGFGR